jgi:PilZ domain
MPELVRSIIGRFREIIGSHNHARRHNVRLPLTIYLHDRKVKRARVSGPLSISGYTRNISDTGLALVVSSMHCGNRYLTDAELTLRIQVELPDGAVSFVVAPVRYEMLEENQLEWGYLVGMRIVEIDDTERERLTHYLRQGHKYEPDAPKTGFAQNAHSL